MSSSVAHEPLGPTISGSGEGVSVVAEEQRKLARFPSESGARRSGSGRVRRRGGARCACARGRRKARGRRRSKGSGAGCGK